MPTTLEWVSVLARGILIPCFLSMVYMFRKKYNENKNVYFNGFFIFFIVFSFTQAVVFCTDLIGLINDDIDLGLLSTSSFSYTSPENEAKLSYFANFVRPSYLLIFFVVLLALGSQVQPLEITLNKEKRLISRAIFLALPLVGLVYIPFLTFSVYTVAVIVYSLAVVVIGFLFNILMSIILFFKSVGEIRKRSFFVLLGFLMLLFGTVWGMRIGLSEAINPNWGYDHDVIFGSIMTILGTLSYYMAFHEKKLA